MNRTTLNFVVDTAAFVGFVLLTTTGVLMHYLPPGSGHHTTIWGWTGTIGGRCISGFPLPSSGHSRCTSAYTGGGLRLWCGDGLIRAARRRACGWLWHSSP